MSDKLPQQPASDEVDLGQVFSYFERIFKKIGKLFILLFETIKWIIKKVLILILILLSTLKKHFIKIGASGILTFATFYFVHIISTPIYQSNIIVKQNYNTGNVLYNDIARYNVLATQKDSIGLAKQLGIKIDEAAKFKGFAITDYMNQNELLKDYYGYIKDVDSTLQIPFVEFKMQYDLENYPLQNILVTSRSVDSFDDLSEHIINSINENEYFKKEKERITILIQNKINTLQEMLIKSDTLQKQYINLLEKYYGIQERDDSKETTLNINLSNNKERIDTKEYSLFEEQKAIKQEIIQLQNDLLEKESVVELLKDFSPPINIGTWFDQNKYSWAINVMTIVLLFFALREFNISDLIDQYGNKENLLDN